MLSQIGTTPAGVVINKFYTMSTDTPTGVNTIVAPIGADPKNPALYGGARRFPYNNYRNGFVQQWNFMLEQKIGTNWSFSMGYIGSHGRNLQVACIPINSVQ